MARNKHPEETIQRILDIAFRLFMEKGYEHTSIQDIINNLGGLSKGAIYHHFKSKEDILFAVGNRMTSESNQMLADIQKRTDLNGREKLKAIFKESLDRPVQEELFTVAPNLYNNPKLLLSFLRETIEEAAPGYILPIVRQGISDGSIETEYPEELAELIILVANVWTNPMIFNSNAEGTYRKFMVFGQMLKGLGVDIVDSEMAERVRALSSIYQKNK
ncbi:MAG: TetR/AcrR family transcriptional regulator [Lachnospiraceae bacterium]|nr:TetR/AcrR family transcriptional regulator [Lachnospiraceae bacterium]